MKEEDNKFDRFVQSKLETSTIPDADEEQWNKMAAALDKKNFTRFSFSRFNIVYLLVFLGIAGLVCDLFLNKGNKTGEKQNINPTVKKEEKPIQEENNTPETIVPSVKKKNTTTENKKDPSEERGNRNTSNLVTDMKEPGQLSDTIMNPNSVTIQPLVSKPDSVVKPVVKKIKYVIKRDTIILVDTTKKRKKR